MGTGILNWVARAVLVRFAAINWRSVNRCVLYCLIAGTAFTLASEIRDLLTVWERWSLGLLNCICVTIRGFLDTSHVTKPEALPPPQLAPSQPIIP